ncbi:GNAT family N-acetyltransferase [Vibrio sp. SCSIO 43135]|uniref:GNAT family N-acetyltransferase n=1 Tax=Vibrio sp. SCSIO 43135 TaxID=2819096 RepID=UPI002074AC8B|nr:GNAT family N-acetyltransferase [Vibrio sp. SCSIO 43135]USD44154.1 GNAT family N-acetyltransferase [Vibrio sp. SCSIO 43135]
MEVSIGNSNYLIVQAQLIRNQVFTKEQLIPQALDLDGLDEVSDHILVKKNDEPIATARLTCQSDGSAVLARVAVIKSHRGLGLASDIVNAAIQHAKNLNVTSIEIHAHSYLKNYYEKFGFEFIKEVEMVGEHQLIEMQCILHR